MRLEFPQLVRRCSFTSVLPPTILLKQIDQAIVVNITNANAMRKALIVVVR